MGAILGLFTGGAPIVYVLIVAAVAGIGAYVFDLRAKTAEAQAATISVQSERNELAATVANKDNAIAALVKSRADDSAARDQISAGAMQIAEALQNAKGKVIHATVSNDCQALDDRDRAYLNGVQSILAGAAANHPDSSDQGKTGSQPVHVPAGTVDTKSGH